MPFRILSLDGGGTWAMIQARVLKDIYGDIPGHEILKQFDMAIANSGGSLVLACLCNNMTPSQIVGIFMDKKDRLSVFSPLTFWEKLIPRNFMSLFRGITGMGPKYWTKNKYTGLRELLNKYQNTPAYKDSIFDTRLSAIPKIIGKENLQLLIVGYDYFRRRSNFFRSNIASKTNRFGNSQVDITLGSAIHCSSNAPVNYFDAPAKVKIFSAINGFGRGNWYWDGAVGGFNNPVLAGVTEAITNAPGLPLNEYRVLSIGTGTGNFAVITDYGDSEDPNLKDIAEKNKSNPLAFEKPAFHFFHDVKDMATSILADPPDSATFIAYSVLDSTLSNNNPKIIRINPCLQPELNANTNIYQVPAAYNNSDADFISLVNMDMDATADSEVKLISALCDKFITADKPALPNQLIRGTAGSDYLGNLFYGDAKEGWEPLM